MANNLTNYSEALLLKWLMTAQSATRPTAWYVALYSSDPGESPGGAELSGNGYARQTVTFGTDGTTNDADSGTFTNNSGGDWAQATHLGIFDSLTGGNPLWYGPLAVAKTVQASDTLKFLAGEIDLGIE